MDAALKEVLLNGAARQICIRFPESEKAEITSGITSGSAKLECKLNSGEELNFGECNAAQFTVEIEGIEDITGEIIQVYALVEGYTPEVPLFYGKVYSAVRRPELDTREVTAYDFLYDKGQEDVTSWYRSLFASADSMTLKTFRDALFTYMGIQQESITLLNDTVRVQKIILKDDAVITFGDCVRAICQMNACFGHVSPSGAFGYVSLGENIYDYSENYQALKSSYEEYAVAPIDRIRLYDGMGNISVAAGSGTNTWNLVNNFLLYGLAEQTLVEIANRLMTHVGAVSYVPATVEALISLPIEPGSKINITTHTGEMFSTYALSVLMAGAQLVDQTIIATGKEKRESNLSGEDTLILLDLRLQAAAEAAGAAITESRREYTTTDSTDPPEETAEWSTSPPAHVDGQYIWERTVNTYGSGQTETGEPVLITGNSGEAGEDAVLLRLDSSNGLIFKNNTVDTVLSVTIYKGSQVITDADTMHAVFGAGSYIQWNWLRLGENRYGVLSTDDSRIYDGGFKLRLTPADVDTKVTFQCSLMVE